MNRYTSRAFPSYRHLPGATPHPERDPAGHRLGGTAPGRSLLTAGNWATNEDHLFAVDLFNGRYYWEAHAFWEGLWALEGTDPAVKDVLQALVQLSAACLKHVQDQRRGALKLVDRARETFGRAVRAGASPIMLGIDGGRLCEDVERFVGSGAPPAPQIELVGLVDI